MVKLSGGSCEEAGKLLREFMQSITSSLRTQEIDLHKLNSSRRRHITEKAYSFQSIYNVLIREENDIIKVVGSSKDSYDVKEKLLGQEVSIASPRHIARNFLRRSSSLPRQKTRTREDTDLGRSPDAVYATTVTSSSASHSQTDSQLKPEVQKERGRNSSKSSAQRGRAQSASRLEHKNQSRVNQEPSANDEQDLTPTNEVQISKRKPKMKSHLLNMDKLIKNKFFQSFSK